MPLFRRIPKITAPPLSSRLAVDPTLGDSDAVAVLTAMGNADWAAARAVLACDHDPDDLAFLVGVAANTANSEKWLPDRVRDDLDDNLASLVHGHRLIVWAWEARTRAYAQHVSRDRALLFRERLEEAEEVLQDVVRRDPGNGSAWAGLITVARGLGLPMDEQRRRFDLAVKADPTHIEAHRQMLQNVCEKWYGSDELMHEFARTAVDTAPPGSRLGSIVALAHIERWTREVQRGNRDYLKRKPVRRDLVEAAERSVAHPDYVRGKDWARDNNAFAMAFALAEDWEHARQQFLVIGEHVTERPWMYLNGEVTAYRRMYLRAFDPSARR